MLVLVHFTLAVILFLIQNWIGERSYGRGYIKFSLLDERDEALATNFVIKVFGPTVFLIVVVGTLQYFEWTQFIPNIINVIYCYIAIRILAILLFERIRIVNWVRIVLYYSLILWLATLIYSQFITKISDLLPDFTQIKNEIWILIIVFIYQIGNRIDQEQGTFSTYTFYLPELKQRKKKYILRKHEEFSNKYSKSISEICPENPELKEIVLAIVLFENFNRPRFIRMIERVYVILFKRPTSIGIMQITSIKNITDLESVQIGTKQLFEKYKKVTGSDNSSYFWAGQIIKAHCPDKLYIRQVLFILKAIIDNKFADQKDSTFERLFGEIKCEFGLVD